VDSKYVSDGRKKDSIREMAVLVRTSADAIGRAAALMDQFNLCEAFEDTEMRTLRLMAEDLLNGNLLVAKLATDRFSLDEAVVESQSLKLTCDAAICLRTVTQANASISSENNRVSLKLKRREGAAT
jgi:hypothetical protein